MTKSKINKNICVSIVTITQLSRFNTLLILKKLINLQTYNNIKEWVIVNGCNNMDDGNKLDDLINEMKTMNKDPYNIVLVPYKNGLTLGDNRNRGNNVVSGDIIVCMDDDDYYPPTRVSHAVEQLTKSKFLIAGCSKLYLYDYDMNVLIQSKGHGIYHSTNACMAYKKQYLTNHKYASVNCGEEPSFTNNFTEPLIQLESSEVIIASAHNNNTFNKRELLTVAFIIPDKCSFIGITEPISKFIPDDMLLEYKNIFINKTSDDNDYVYLSGSLTIQEWNPSEIIFGTPEYDLITTVTEMSKEGKKIEVFGNFNDCLYNGVTYTNWKKFNYSFKYNILIIWQMSGLVTHIPFNINANKIIFELYEFPNQDLLRVMLMNKHKINKIIFKNKFIAETYKNFYQLELNNNNVCVVPYGINKNNLDIFKFNNIETKRDINRCCYMCNVLNYQILEQLIYFMFNIIIQYNPNIKLHLYYNKTNATEQENILKFVTLFSQFKNNIILHINPTQDDIINEYFKSTFYFNLSPSISDININYILEAVYCGCIPLIGSSDLHLDCPGIQFDLNNQDNKIKIISTLFNLANNINQITNLHNECLNTYIMSINDISKYYINIFDSF
jgi:hypothetical protein